MGATFDDVGDELDRVRESLRHVEQEVVDGVRRGLSLIDLSSDGTNHYMRFENMSDRSRVIIRLTHLTGSMTSAAVQGHRVGAVIGYGEKMKNFSKVWSNKDLGNSGR